MDPLSRGVEGPRSSSAGPDGALGCCSALCSGAVCSCVGRGLRVHAQSRPLREQSHALPDRRWRRADPGHACTHGKAALRAIGARQLAPRVAAPNHLPRVAWHACRSEPLLKGLCWGVLVVHGLVATLTVLNHLLDALHLGNVVAEHVLDAAAQRGGGGGAPHARASHLEPHDAGLVVERHEENVPPVLLHSWADAHLDELPDHSHDLVVVVAVGGGVVNVVAALKDGLRAGEAAHDGRHDQRLDVLPLRILVLVHSHKVATQKHAGDVGQAKQL
mmetsp:Transcript_4432/g.18836  ORF Transcript_4432/g.18836 Transcript_4432/m.18836 type:complete len:275 (-) Transcript_4432:321-1145(-)